MSALINGTYPGGQAFRPAALSGSSSGALSAVILNAIIATEELGLGDAGITMDRYRDLLFTVDNDQIYNSGVWSITKSVIKGWVLDNEPMRELIASWVGRMGWKKLGDLYIPTCISVVNQSTGYTQRLWSDDPNYAQLDLVDVIIASTALPIAFQPREIQGLPGLWIDGGTGDDTLPITPLLERPHGVTKIYALAYGSSISSGGASLPAAIKPFKLLANALAVVADMRVSAYLSALEIAASSPLHANIYSYIPKLPKQYSVLDFGSGREEYFETAKYCISNGPKPINWTDVPQLRFGQLSEAALFARL